MANHRQTPAPVLALHRGDAPDELCNLVAKTLEKEPEDRFQSADEIDRELTCWLKASVANSDNSPVSIVVTDPTAGPAEKNSDQPVVRMFDTPVVSDPETETHNDRAIPDPVVPVHVDSSSSVVARRRQVASRSRVKVPLALWITMGVLAVACVALAVYVVMQNS